MKTFAFTVVFVALLVSSCNKDENNNVEENDGKITGEIRLTDEFGIEQAQHDGMVVSVQTGESGTSMAGGAFQISDLKTGSYNLTYSKTGFGSYKKFNILVNAGSNGTVLNGINYLGMKSTSLISGLNISFSLVDSSYNISCNVNPVPDSTHQRAFRLFFSKTPDVNYNNFLYNPSNSWVSTTGSGVITGFQRQNFYNNGFQAGDSVYAVAFGEAIVTNTYNDPLTGAKVYPNLNVSSSSNIFGFVMQ